VEARRVIGRAAIAVAVADAGCGHGAAPSSSGSAAPPTVADPLGAAAAVGTRVRVAGTAVDDKASAVVDAGALSVHCLDLGHWSADRLGRPVVVEGTLESTDELEARTTSTGLVTQGRRGNAYVIRRCTIR
jgi:hypothetical protein